MLKTRNWTWGQRGSRGTRADQGVRPTLGLDFDFDLARLGGFLLGEGDSQDAVLEGGADFLGIEGIGHAEAALEFAVAAFDPVIAGGGLLLFEFALAGDGQGLVFDADINVL